MWLFRKLREIEWIWSLWSMVANSAFVLAWLAALLAMLGAIVTALYSFASWINEFGAGGWVLASAAALFICALVVGTTAWAWQRIRVARSGSEFQQSNESRTKKDAREGKLDDMLRRIDRSVFLLLVGATDEGTHRALWKALKTLPERSTADNDEELLIIKNRLRLHEGETNLALRGTRWAQDFSRIMAETEYTVDVDMRTAVIPDGIHPMVYREYAIASAKRDALEGFLERAIADSDETRDRTLEMLRDQKSLHEKT